MYAQALKDKTLEYRKAKNPLATFLISVGSKANDIAKAEDPKATTFGDDQALRAINSFLKGAEENITLLSATKNLDQYQRALAERELLKSFLPAEATEDEVRTFATDFVATAGATADRKKLMGPLMKALNDHFGASLNKKTASGIVQSVLNA